MTHILSLPPVCFVCVHTLTRVHTMLSLLLYALPTFTGSKGDVKRAKSLTKVINRVTQLAGGVMRAKLAKEHSKHKASASLYQQLV